MDYDKLIAPAAKAMRPSGIRKFFDLAAEMPECISLGVGEPDFKTPWAVREAGIDSLEHGRTRYTSNAGLKELRAEISRYLERRMNLRYDPMRQILVTVGGSEAIDMCIRTLVQPGDEVIIPEPCFVCYEPITTLSGGVPVHVACRQEDEFRLRADALKAAITPKTKLVIMPFPNNPTGAVMEREDLEAVAEVLRGTDIMVLSDEIYAELNYGLRPHVSIATLPGMAERTIVVNGFSKSYAMTGWRVGDPAQQLQSGAVIAHAGGVAGIVEHNELGTGGDGRPETGFVNGPALACIGGDLHTYASGQLRLGAVEGEVGGKDDDLVTGVQNGQHHQRHSHAAGSGDQNVIRGEGLLEIRLPGVTDGADQLRITLRISIVGVPGLSFPEGGVDDGVIGDKVRVADAEINDVRIPGQRIGVQTQSGVGILKSLGDI